MRRGTLTRLVVSTYPRTNRSTPTPPAWPANRLADQVVDVRERVGDIAELQRQQILLRFAAEGLFDASDVAHQLDGLVVADVVQPIRRLARARVGIITVPRGIRSCDAVRRVHHALRDVIDEREVAAVIAVVEDVDRLAGQDVLREQEQRHVGTTPRPVHREEAQSRHRQFVEIGVRVRHQLVRLLGRGVERQRMIDILMHGERHLRIRAVHRAGRRVDEMLGAVVPAAFEDVGEADDVAVDVRERILQRVAHARLRCEVNHASELLPREQLLHARPVREIQLDEAEVRPLPQLREPRFLKRDVVVVVEVVEPDDFVAALQRFAPCESRNPAAPVRETS